MAFQQGAHVTPVGTLSDGGVVQSIRLSAGGTVATILTHGARLADLRRQGMAHPLALGSPSFEAYLGPMEYFGAVVGPVANRIAVGRFSLEGVEYRLDRNEGGITTLHGGAEGFSARNWYLVDADRSSCTLTIDQRDGLNGFPGALSIAVRYALEEDGALTLEITGRTARTCLCAPAFHGYWNLDGSADLSQHRLTVHAEAYLEVDAELIPRGAPVALAGTAFDYRAARPIDAGLDHNFCLSTARGPLREACRLETDRLTMIVETTEPGLQIYSAGRMDTAPVAGLSGQPYGRMAGIAIEPQIWPDAANRPDFPSARLDPGETYRQITRFRFVTP